MMSYNCLLRWNPSKKEGKNRGQQRLGTSFQYLSLICNIISAKARNQRHPMSVLKGIFIMLLTCIMNGISHLKTTDGAGFAFSVPLEDQLKSREEMDSQMRAWKPFKTLFCQNGAILYLPGLDLFPQVFELMQVQFSSPISLKRGQLWQNYIFISTKTLQ